MQCEEFEERLNAVLDERRRPEADAELRLHCENCPPCHQIASSYDALLDGFYALSCATAAKSLEPADFGPSDLGVRVLAELRPVPAYRGRSFIAIALATAATLLIALVPFFRGTSQDPPVGLSVQRNASTQKTNLAMVKRSGVRPQTSGPSTVAFASIPLASLPMVPELLSIARSEADDPYVDLAKETGQSLATVVLYVPGIGGAKGIMDIETDPEADEPAWAIQMSEGLRPVTESVTETLNILLRSFPVAELASRS